MKRALGLSLVSESSSSMHKPGFGTAEKGGEAEEKVEMGKGKMRKNHFVMIKWITPQ